MMAPVTNRATGASPSTAQAVFTAADVLRLDQLGTVATGTSADFLVLDANPLDNIANTRRINTAQRTVSPAAEGRRVHAEVRGDAVQTGYIGNTSNRVHG